MDYLNLGELLKNSSSSRRFFLSLDNDLKGELLNRARFIHNAFDLHFFAEQIPRYNKAIKLSMELIWLFSF